MSRPFHQHREQRRANVSALVASTPWPAWSAATPAEGSVAVSWSTEVARSAEVFVIFVVRPGSPAFS